MVTKKLLSGPGASTRGAGVGPALSECIRQGYNFDYFVGVSYSSLISVPLALGLHDLIEKESITLNHNKFFDVSPMTKKGGISFQGIMRAIGSIFAPKRVNSFGVQNIHRLLKQFVNEALFEQYQNGDYPIIYICAVEVESKRAVLWNIKDKSVDYNTYLDMVSASARIPIWTQSQAVTYQGKTRYYYDGGVTDTNAANLVLELHKDIDEVISIYPGGFTQNNPNPSNVNGIFQSNGSIDWMINAMLQEIVIRDIEAEFNLCNYRNIKLTQIFLPNVLENLYDTDNTRLNELKDKSIELVKKVFKNEKQ